MWANLQDRKLFRSIKVTYKVIGLNQDRLIALLKKHDIDLYDIKKLTNRVMLVSVNLNQSKNFFAITKEMCYNVKKVRFKGKALPIFKLMGNLGLLFGALAFLTISYLASDLVLGFSFSGSGKIYQREVLAYLQERGIQKYSSFSSFKVERLEDEILSASPHLTFVSVQKKGNTLALYLTLKTEVVKTLGNVQGALKSTASGVVESIKVYRGTALVSVGDRVNVGDILVDSYAVIKDQRIETGVLAYVTVIEERAFTYRLKGEDKTEQAIILAEQELNDLEIISSSVDIKKITEQLYDYAVSVCYRRIIYE